jgi:uncharacterized protein (TIGR02453 family)
VAPSILGIHFKQEATMGRKPSFTPELFRFLSQLRKNNDREWFAANKARYESSIRDPFLRFIADFAPFLRKISPHFVADPSPTRGSMMRIYRDIRFSRDKSPYKTAVAAHFWHEKGKEGATPGFYLQLEPGKSLIGAGLWRPEPKAVKTIRDAIAKDSQQWRTATTGREFHSSFDFGGESLKRPPRGYDGTHPFIEDIKRKDFVAGAVLPDGDVCSPDFLATLVKRLRILTPYMKFLTEAVGLPF